MGTDGENLKTFEGPSFQTLDDLRWNDPIYIINKIVFCLQTDSVVKLQLITRGVSTLLRH